MARNPNRNIAGFADVCNKMPHAWVCANAGGGITCSHAASSGRQTEFAGRKFCSQGTNKAIQVLCSAAVGSFQQYRLVMALFQFLLRRTGSARTWRASGYSELPEVHSGASEVTVQFLIVAGGLALVLSRHNEQRIRANYPASNELYLLLRRELSRHGRTSASAELLNDVMHETAAETDPATRSALRACFDARLAYEARRRVGGGASRRKSDGQDQAAADATGATLH